MRKNELFSHFLRGKLVTNLFLKIIIIIIAFVISKIIIFNYENNNGNTLQAFSIIFVYCKQCANFKYQTTYKIMSI